MDLVERLSPEVVFLAEGNACVLPVGLDRLTRLTIDEVSRRLETTRVVKMVVTGISETQRSSPASVHCSVLAKETPLLVLFASQRK